MAVTNFSDLSNILLSNYGPLIAQAFTEYGPGNQLMPVNSIMGRLAANGRIQIGSGDGSDRYAKEWGVHTTAFSAASYGANDAYPASVAPTFAQAQLEWKRLGIAMEFDNLVRLAGSAATRGNTNALSFEFQAKLKALIHALESQLATDGTGNSSKDVTGFLAFLSDSNTYATINQATASYWQAQLVNASAASLAKTNLQSIAKTLHDNGSIGPSTEIWMSATQWHKYTALYSSELRYAPGSVGGDAMAPRYSDGLVDLPIYVLPSMSAAGVVDEVWFVDLSSITLHLLDHSPADTVPVEADDEVTHEGVPVGVEAVDTGKDSKAIFVKCYPQLSCTNPRNNGRIYGLAT